MDHIEAQQGNGEPVLSTSAVSGLKPTRLSISPSLVTIDPSTRSATIEFFNETSDTLDAEISVTIDAPLRIRLPNTANSVNGKSSFDGLLGAIVRDDQLGDKQAETKPENAFIQWIAGIPPRLMFLPGEKKIVQVTVTVPADAKPGEYKCWVVSRATAQGGIVRQNGFGLMGADGKPIRIPSFVKMFFTVRKGP